MKTYVKSLSNLVIILVVSIFGGLASCFDSNFDKNNISDEMEFTPGIAMPIAHGSLSLDDLLTKMDSTNIIGQKPDSLLFVYYSADLFTKSAADLIKISNQQFADFSIGPKIPAAFVIPGAIGDTITEIVIPFIGTVIPLTFDQNLEFKFENGERIDSLVLKNIRMLFSVKSTFQNEVVLNFHTENIKVDGKPWSKRIPLTSSDLTIEEVIKDFKIQLSFNDTAATTQLALKIDVVLINQGETIRPGDHCDITMSFLENTFSGAYGYLGKYEIFEDSGQIDVSFLNTKILGGKISFAEPKLVLTVNNSFALPVAVDLDMEAVSSIDYIPDTITFAGRNPFTIGAPQLENYNEIVPTTIEISKDSSNLIQVMETAPDVLKYKAIATINPKGKTAHYNYVTENSTVNASVEFNLPIHLSAKGFAFEDTLNMDFEKMLGSKYEMFDSLGITLDITNGIPLEADIQVYFTDSLWVVLDSMFIDDSNFLEPAILGPDGKHTIPAIKSNRIEYIAERLEKIKGAKFARIRASINTPVPAPGNSEYFKFFSFYKIGFNLSANAYLRVNTKNL